MKKKRIKSKNKDIGFISSNGICIDGDILMNCEREHNSGSFLWFQILLTFVATICTAFMAVSFLDMEIYKTTIIYYSAMLSLVFGLMKSSHKIIKFSALGVMILHVIYLVSRISTIKYGLFVVIDRKFFRIFYNSCLPWCGSSLPLQDRFSTAVHHYISCFRAWNVLGLGADNVDCYWSVCMLGDSACTAHNKPHN